MATTVDGNQKSFRGRNDDGTEVTATYIAALNTNWSQAQDANFRLRYAIAITSGGTTWNNLTTIKFQYNKNSAGWNDITSASSNVRLFTSANVTDETATTQLISSPDTFLAGNVLTSSTTTSNTLGAGGSTIEDEICAQIRSADTTVGDTIQIRIVNSSTLAATTYTNTVTITVTAGASFDVKKASTFALFF
jgi:hypothetical protein